MQVNKYVSASSHEYVGPNRYYASSHYIRGARVITELYFVIFAAFKESVTLNLAHRSSMLVPIESAYSLHIAISGQ